MSAPVTDKQLGFRRNRRFVNTEPSSALVVSRHRHYNRANTVTMQVYVSGLLNAFWRSVSFINCYSSTQNTILLHE